MNGVTSCRQRTGSPCFPAPFSSDLIAMWSHRTYQHHNILHVFKLFWVKEGCELFSVCRQVPVQISPFKPPLIARKHLLEAELVGCILEFLRVGLRRKSTIINSCDFNTKCNGAHFLHAKRKHSALTEVVSIRGLLVLIPWDLVVFVQVIICPNLCHILIHITLLHTFNPSLEFSCSDVAIGVAVYPVHYFTVRQKGEKRQASFVKKFVTRGRTKPTVRPSVVSCPT